MESVESKKKETKPDIFCNCTKSKCLYHVCRCFAARLYCEGDCSCDNCHNKQDYKDTGGESSTRSSSSRRKIGCQCQKLKCVNKCCKCYMDEIGCSKKCRCGDCDNSFGKKPEPMLRGAEYWKDRSHKMSTMGEVISDSTKVATATLLSPTQEKLTDKNHLTVSTHPPVPSLISHNIGDFQNVSRAESENGTNFHGYSSALSPKQPFPSKVSDESPSSVICELIGDEMVDSFETTGVDLHRLFSVYDDISEMLEDDEIAELADAILGVSNTTNTMKSESAGQPTDATVPCSPTPTTCCNSGDGLNQTEIDHQGDSHDK